MDLLTHLRRLFAYDAWANREALECLRKASPPPPDAVRLLGHIAGAEWVWLARIRGEDGKMEIWPDLPLERVGRELVALEGTWSEYLAHLTPESLERPVSYVNSRGELWTSTVADILTHVATHSAYHRGQIATRARAAGATPAYTDFIHSVRQGIIE